MGRDLNADYEAVTLSGQILNLLLVMVDTDSGPVRLFAGRGSIEFNDETWYGAGKLLNVSSVNETTDVEAVGSTLTVSGVPVEFLQQAETEIRPGHRCEIWVGALDDGGVIIGEPVMVFAGYTDVITTADSQTTCSVSINVENRLIDLTRAPNGRYTDQDQQQRHPGDLGFEFVAALQDLTVTWGQV